jgi:hypothetical protein
MSFLTIAFQTGAFQEEVAAGEMQEFPAKAGIAVRNRARWYIIDGQRLYLDEQELAVVVATKLNEIARTDVREEGHRKPISRKKWGNIKKSIGVANPVKIVDNGEEEDEEAFLMLL